MSAPTEKGIRIIAPFTWVAIGAVLIAGVAMVLDRVLPATGANPSESEALAQEIVLNASAAAAGDNAAYDALELEFQIAVALIRRRLEKGLTQRELAKRVGTKQSAIARLESGSYNPTLGFLKKVTSALDARLTITSRVQR